MGRRISQAIARRSRVVADGLVIRLNWPRVVFAGLLAATVAILATLRFLATNEHKAASVASSAVTEVSSAPKADSAPSPQAASSATTEVSSAPKADSPILQLVSESAAQGTNDRLPLGIFVRGPSEILSAATIEISGLPFGWALSAGQPLGNRWRIPAAQLSGAAILPRPHFFAVDLEVELRLADDTLVERRSVRLAMTDQELATENTMKIKLFLSKGEELLAQGDFSAARLSLQRAAQLGSAEARRLLDRIPSLEPKRPGLDRRPELDLRLASTELRFDRLASGDPPRFVKRSSVDLPSRSVLVTGRRTFSGRGASPHRR
jgi:uncharacterized membrane protein